MDYYEHLLQSIAEPPILIGHCIGGVVVQYLLDRGLGVAGVALNTPPLSSHRPRRFEAARQWLRLSRPATPPAPPVGASRSRAPLLLVGSGMDDLVPASLIEQAAERGPEGTVTSYLEYPDACHHLVHTPGWQQINDDVLDWATLYAAPDRLTGADI
ncbi:alpha-beta hydrolase superfamily lysophospholipase [Catenulispora sp. MAP5-51]